jgi:hypothetical protein
MEKRFANNKMEVDNAKEKTAYVRGETKWKNGEPA